MTLSAQLNVNFTARLTGAGDLGTPTANINLSGQLVFANGTGVDQADKLFADTRSLAASATEDLDLAGSLLDPLGAAFTPAKVKGIFIKAHDDNPGNLTIGGDANSVPFLAAANDAIPLPPGGLLPLFWPGTGVAVTASTGDIVQVAAAATAGTYGYDIIVLATSA